MLDRAKSLKILVESSRRIVDDIDMALEELESGAATKTNYSTIQRAFHTIKHDARHLRLEKLAHLAEAAETIVERAADEKLGLPFDILHATSAEIRKAAETVATGGRHKLNTALLKRLKTAAKRRDAGR